MTKEINTANKLIELCTNRISYNLSRRETINPTTIKRLIMAERRLEKALDKALKNQERLIEYYTYRLALAVRSKRPEIVNKAARLAKRATLKRDKLLSLAS